MQTDRTIANRELLATCWTWAGDAAPGAADETSPLDIGTRIAAVSAAGWAGVGIVLADLRALDRDPGFGVLDRMLRDAGINLVELEFLTDWWESGAARAQSDEDRRLLFRAAASLGATTIKVSGQYADPPVDWTVFAESLDGLARDAADHGTRVAVEPMPMNNIVTLQRGMELVRGVDHPAAGLCVDTQHVFRGGTSYADFASFLDIDKVFVVELDDSLRRPVVDGLFEDAVNHRLYPGHGELEVPAFVAAMVELGWTGPWGVEIISAALRALPVEDAVRGVFDATMKVLDDAERLLRGADY